MYDSIIQVPDNSAPHIHMRKPTHTHADTHLKLYCLMSGWTLHTAVFAKTNSKMKLAEKNADKLHEYRLLHLSLSINFNVDCTTQSKKNKFSVTVVQNK